MDDAIEASVRADCPCCGIVELPGEQVRLSMRTAPAGDWHSVVVFRCGGCGDVHEQPVDERTSRLLSGAGLVLEAPVTQPHRDQR